MTRSAYFFGVAVAALAMTAMPHAQAPARPAPRPALVRSSADDAARYAGVIKQYCAQCHNARLQTSATASGVVFDTVDFSSVQHERGDVGEGGAQAARRRDAAVGHAASGRGDARGPPHLARGSGSTQAAATPNPGRPVLHRLNRTEYRNAIRDLLALDIGDVASLLPPDDSAYGFDNDRRLPRRVAGAARALPVGGRAHQRAGRGRSLDVVPGSDDLYRAPGSVAGQAHRRHAVRHRRRHQGHAHVPGGWRVRPAGHAATAPTWTRPAGSSTRTRSRSRWTASACSCRRSAARLPAIPAAWTRRPPAAAACCRAPTRSTRSCRCGCR